MPALREKKKLSRHHDESDPLRSNGRHLGRAIQQNVWKSLVQTAKFPRLFHRYSGRLSTWIFHSRYLKQFHFFFWFIFNKLWRIWNIAADWLLILVHFIKYLRHGQDANSTTTDGQQQETDQILGDFSLKDYRLEGLPYYILPAMAVSYIIYLGVGGFLHWFYYVRQRDRPEEWKCQPNKWLSPELERHEILLGASSLLIGSIISGTLSCYIMNGGWTMIYYDYSEYGYIWGVLQYPAIFIWQVFMRTSRQILISGNSTIFQLNNRITWRIGTTACTTRRSSTKISTNCTTLISNRRPSPWRPSIPSSSSTCNSSSSLQCFSFRLTGVGIHIHLASSIAAYR